MKTIKKKCLDPRRLARLLTAALLLSQGLSSCMQSNFQPLPEPEPEISFTRTVVAGRDVCFGWIVSGVRVADAAGRFISHDMTL